MVVDLQLNKQLSARDSRGIKLIKIRPSIERDPSAADGGKLKLTFVDGDVAPFSIPLRPSSKEVENWEMCVLSYANRHDQLICRTQTRRL